jgi:hypothetical protein
MNTLQIGFAMSGVKYLFLDESGNFDFSPTGSPLFTITSVLASRPFTIGSALSELRYDLLEEGCDIQEFHATEDRQAVRDRVFRVLQNHLGSIRIDSIIVRKCMIAPSWREPEVFYPNILGYLLRWVTKQERLTEAEQVIVILDVISHRKRRKAIEASVKKTLSRMLPKSLMYRVLHQDSKSSVCLQIADYANWAIHRKWSRGDDRSHRYVRDAIKSEFDIFKSGYQRWY